MRSGDSRVELIVASGDCYIGIFGYQLARTLGARFAFDVYDKYDEFRGYISLPGFDPFRFLLRRADAVLFASQALLDRSDGGSGPKILVPNGVDYGNFRPLDMWENRHRFGLEANSRYIGYFGSLTPDRGGADLIAAVSELRSGGFEVDVVLAGKQEGVPIPDLPWVHYLGNLPYEDVPRAMACCDLLTLPYRSSGYLDMASSCKIAEYIAVQRPIVATNTLNFRSNFPEQYAALSDLVAIPGSPADLKRVIQEQFSVRRLVEPPERFSWESISTDLAGRLLLKAEGVN